MRILLNLATLLLITFLSPRIAQSKEPKFAPNTCWRIESSKELKRWVIVRKFDEERKIFHIEVLERKRHSKPWEFKRLTPHMAITQQALERSLQQLLPADIVYPESFDSAYESWNGKSVESKTVCDTTVSECLLNT